MKKSAKITAITVAACLSACSAEQDDGDVGEQGPEVQRQEEPEDTAGNGAAPWEEWDDVPEDWDLAKVEGGTVRCAEIVATVVRDVGTTLVFCVTDESWSVSEIGHLDDLAAPVDPAGKCADEIFAEEAPGEPVPEPLVDICDESRDLGRLPPQMQEGGSFGLMSGGQPSHASDAVDDILAPPRTMRGHYCAGSGYDDFHDEVCVGNYYSCNGPEQCFCYPGLYTWHQHTSNDKCGYADETQAACTQVDRKRMSHRQNVAPYSWDTDIDVTIAPNYWARHSMESNALNGHYFRVRGDSDEGGHHRYVGMYFSCN